MPSSRSRLVLIAGLALATPACIGTSNPPPSDTGDTGDTGDASTEDVAASKKATAKK